MEEYIQLISVPVIASIVYGIIGLLTTATKHNETFMKLIPLVSAAIGMVCSVIAFYAIPGYIEASNVFMAIMVGAASGLSATGTNQIINNLNQRARRMKMAKQKNKNLQYDISLAIINMLLNKGLITKEEKDKIDVKNKATFPL